MGGVRTALYNYLFAKANGGEFLLRIEDTDQTRFVKGAEDYIEEALSWCGIKIDEGVKEGGDSGPYKQSHRSELYASAVADLLDKGMAYRAFDTPEELKDESIPLAAREKMQVTVLLLLAVSPLTAPTG